MGTITYEAELTVTYLERKFTKPELRKELEKFGVEMTDIEYKSVRKHNLSSDLYTLIKDQWDNEENPKKLWNSSGAWCGLLPYVVLQQIKWMREPWPGLGRFCVFIANSHGWLPKSQECKAVLDQLVADGKISGDVDNGYTVNDEV
jgi:hypothetical protein